MAIFYVKPQGCTCNIADASKISKYLISQGHTLTNVVHKADKIIIVTCGFNELKLNKSLNELNRLNSLFKNKLYIAGCVPKIRPDSLKNFNVVASPRDFSGLNLFANKVSNKSIDDVSPSFFKDNLFYIKISTGCTGKCSFCAIKKASGFTKSRSINSIIKDVNFAIKKGYSKIALIGDDIGSWGADVHLKLSDLLSELILLDGDFELMLSSIHPKNLLKDKKIIQLLNSKKIGNTIYLPHQSASNKILNLMNREYSIQDYFELVKEIKLVRPDMQIQSDLLVGFPTESEEDHKKNLKFIKSTNIYFLQVFMYTPMKGTLSEKFTDIPEDIKLRRCNELIDLFLEKNANEDRLLINTNINYNFK